MNINLKRQAALQLLASTGIWRINYETPILLLLWRFGFNVPPPHFVSFHWNAIFAGTYFGVFWGIFMWVFLWSGSGTSVTEALTSAVMAGVFFGLIMASYYSYGKRKHRLPSWSEFNP